VIGGEQGVDKKRAVGDSDDDLDEEEEKILSSLRDKRLAEMKAQQKEAQENKTKGHGQYREIVEGEFLPEVTGSKLVVCHFYHNDFERCKIVDMHLRTIAQQHQEAKFIYINAEKSPFFVGKLAIQVLPTIVCFIDGIAVDRVVGFEDLGGADDFPTLALTRRLVKAGVVKPRNKSEKGTVFKRAGKDDDSDDDDSS